MASQAPVSFSTVVDGEVNQSSEQQQGHQDILSPYNYASLINGLELNNFASLQAIIDRHCQEVDQFLVSQANGQLIFYKHVLEQKVSMLLSTKDNELAILSSKLEAALAALRKKLCENAILSRDLREVSAKYEVVLQKLRIAERSSEGWQEIANKFATSIEELRGEGDQANL